jgi:Cu-Zn family superoxide dismutase
LGNILAKADGTAVINIQDSVALLDGAHSIVGRAIVIHAKPDDLGKGGKPDSNKTGAAGARIACGVISKQRRR